MNSRFEKIFSDAETRYLEENEIQDLRNYVSSFNDRIEAMNNIQKAEEKIVQEVINTVWKKHPDFPGKYNLSKEKCSRDVRYTLRYCTLAMVRDDKTFLSEKLLYWMRTILHAFDFSEVIDTTYSTLASVTTKSIDERSAKLISPYLDMTHRILTLKQEE